MKTTYICEGCGKVYSTIEEAKRCEEKHNEAHKKNELLKQSKKEKLDELSKLFNEFINTFHESPKIEISQENELVMLRDIFNAMCN